MKYLIFLILAVSFTFAQAANGNGSVSNIELNIRLLNIIKPEVAVTWLKSDFNKDGYYEILKGEQIIKISENRYWVRNTTLSFTEGDIISFGNNLKINDKDVLNQVQAKHGYIVVFEQGKHIMEIYIADVYGSRDSDVYTINY